MKKTLAMMLALGLAVPVNAVNRRVARRRYVARKVVKAKNYSDVIGVAMFVVGAILLSLASYCKRRYGNNDDLAEIRAERDAALEPAFPEPVSTGQAHVDEPVDMYASYRNAHRDLDTPAEESDWDTSSDDDDVSDTCANPDDDE